MRDLIDRQAAIDAFEKELSAKYNRRELAIGFVGVKSILEKLPSAQPEIIRCKDCKYFERDIKRSWGTYNGCGVWTDDGNEIEVNQYDFCSYAERRTDDSISD